MANTFTPQDVHAIVNAMAAEMYGSENTLQAVDTSSFVTVGEHMLRTGYTNTLDALGIVIGRMIVAVRPYRGRFRIIAQTPAEWGGIERKISYYSKTENDVTSRNTQLAATQLADGQSIDPWKISNQYPLQMDFIGEKLEQLDYTTYTDQLKAAFRNEGEFSRFMDGKLTAIANDLESLWEARNRLHVLNAIAATKATGTARQAVNMTAFYNTFRGTTFTTAQLLSKDNFADFIEVFMMKLEGDMELARERNELFHIYPAKNDGAGNALVLNRHTPPEMRRLLLYMPIIRQGEKTVFPALFDSSALRLENYEGVEYWQNPNDPAAIDVVPNVLNASTGQSADGARQQISTVLALFFDRDALATSVKVSDVLTTPVNARGKYFNTVYHWNFMHKQDQTENMIVYYMEDE